MYKSKKTNTNHTWYSLSVMCIIIELLIIEGRKLTMTIKEIDLEVQAYRRMPNPYGLKDPNGLLESYILQVDVTKIPEGISLETNPREQNMRTKVARKIKEGLMDSSTPFHILNRGILLSARNISFNNKSSHVTIDMGDNPVIYGIVDGGHTYRTILECKEAVIKQELTQYVRIEVLTGIEDIFQNVADSRNTSTQVTDQAIAELNDKFTPIIKDALTTKPYAGDIAYRENEEARIDVSDILALMFMFNIDKFPDKDNLPVQAYSAKASTLRSYLKEYDAYGATSKNAYYKMKDILPDIIELADEIEITMAEKYQEFTGVGAFGRVRGVDRIDRTSLYLERELHHKISKGLIFPIIGAFRALVKEENEKFIWLANPIDTWNKVGATLVGDTIGRSRSFNNNPNAAGKDIGLWRQNYQTVFTEFLMEQYNKK